MDASLQIVPAMGGNDGDLAHVISTIFFISGIITLLQTTVGDRLPIIQVSLSSPRAYQPLHINESIWAAPRLSFLSIQEERCRSQLIHP